MGGRGTGWKREEEEGGGGGATYMLLRQMETQEIKTQNAQGILRYLSAVQVREAALAGGGVRAEVAASFSDLAATALFQMTTVPLIGTETTVET